MWCIQCATDGTIFRRQGVSGVVWRIVAHRTFPGPIAERADECVYAGAARAVSCVYGGDKRHRHDGDRLRGWIDVHFDSPFPAAVVAFIKLASLADGAVDEHRIDVACVEVYL